MGKLKVFKESPKTKSLEERVTESCCSFHVGLDGVYDSPKPIKFIMAKNGVMKVVQNAVGLFVVGTNDVPGLPDLVEGLALSIPKVPYHMLLQTITFFRSVMEKFNNAEAMVQFYYDSETSSYIMYCPDQEVSGVNVDFKRDPVMDESYTLVMDIHSHNTMGAFFSTIDDADEKETRVFGVLGKLKDETPEMKFRISVGGDFKDIGVFDIFEYPFPDTSFPEEWLNKCVKRSAYTVYGKNNFGTRTRTRYNTSDKYSNFYDEYEDLYNIYSGGATNNPNSRTTTPSKEDLHTMSQNDLVDLIKDALLIDVEAVALAILEERMEDDIIDFIHRRTINNLLGENDL